MGGQALYNMRKAYKGVQSIGLRIAAACNLFKHKARAGGLGDSRQVHTSRAVNQIAEYLGEFRDARVSEVMIPRTTVIAMPVATIAQDLYEKFVLTRLTRMPIYKKNLDDIVGFVHIKDFLLFAGETKRVFEMRHTLRSVIYTPRSTKCIDLLTKMRTEGTHLAVVLDEYGGTEGLVTISCLIGGLIGDIHDEHDEQGNNDDEIQEIGECSYILDAKTTIQDLEKRIGALDFLSEEEGEYDTIGGFVLAYLGHIPEKGIKFKHPAGLEVEILDANQRKIDKLKLTFEKCDNSVATIKATQ